MQINCSQYALCKRHIGSGNMAMPAKKIACNYIKQATTHEITQNTDRKTKITQHNNDKHGMNT